MTSLPDSAVRHTYSNDSDELENDENSYDEPTEVHALNNVVAQSMSIGEDSHSEYDEMSASQRQNRWGRLRTVRSHDYEYDYLDEGVYVGRGFNVLLPSKKLLIGIGVFCMISILAALVPKQSQSRRHPTVRKYKGAPQITCPEDPKVTPGHVSSLYQPSSPFMDSLEHNLTDYLHNFRELPYEDLNITYDNFKKRIKEWKTKYFVPNLKTGDSIFESGSCGVGLNLLSTLEIVYQANKNVRELHVYGTSFSQEAAGHANIVLDDVLQMKEIVGGGKRGVICGADSTDLSFIEDSSFDLVFSGRISPQPDPWSVNITTPSLVLARRRELCTNQASDWKSKVLLELSQNIQNDWYQAWITEMIRIAKPGAPVIVEMVSDPYCDETTMDVWGGGVPYSFWYNRFDNVDPDSIQFEKDTVLPNPRRYHVFMRKKKPKA